MLSSFIADQCQTLVYSTKHNITSSTTVSRNNSTFKLFYPKRVLWSSVPHMDDSNSAFDLVKKFTFLMQYPGSIQSGMRLLLSPLRSVLEGIEISYTDL